VRLLCIVQKLHARTRTVMLFFASGDVQSGRTYSSLCALLSTFVGLAISLARGSLACGSHVHWTCEQAALLRRARVVREHPLALCLGLLEGALSDLVC
jgi:hypothetical protein